MHSQCGNLSLGHDSRVTFKDHIAQLTAFGNLQDRLRNRLHDGLHDGLQFSILDLLLLQSGDIAVVESIPYCDFM